MQKNLGHYVGEVEDIDVDSLKFKLLDQRHREAITLGRIQIKLSNELKQVNERLSEIRSQLMVIQKIDPQNWMWIWEKKRTSVKWKDEFVKALGQRKADAITKKYKTKKHPQLGIKYVDPIPDSIIQIKENPPKFKTIKHKLKS